MAVEETKQVQRSPNWMNHLAQIVKMRGTEAPAGPFPAGTPTLARDEMVSRERMHASDLAERAAARAQQYQMHQEGLSHSMRSQAQSEAHALTVLERTHQLDKDLRQFVFDLEQSSAYQNPILDQDLYNQAMGNPRAPGSDKPPTAHTQAGYGIY